MTDGTTNPEVEAETGCTCDVAEAIIEPSLLSERQLRRVEAAYIARDLLSATDERSGSFFGPSASTSVSLLSRRATLVPDIVVIADWILGDSIEVRTADGSVALEVDE